jgi:YaiO family outer membrane protein
VRRTLALLCAACAALASAEEPRPYPWDLRLEGARDDLDKGREDWREAAAQLAWRPTTRQSVSGGYRGTERYGLTDREGLAGAYLPIPGITTAVHVEGTWSGTHRVLPRNAWLGELAQPLPSGWVVSAGGKRSRFTSADVQSAWTTLEKYVGDFRFAWQAQVSRPEGASWAPAHRLTASWYRGDLTYVTLNGSRGRELENIPPFGLVSSDVRAISLSGGIEIAPRWGLTGEIAWTHQGDLYNRRTARLGTRLLF